MQDTSDVYQTEDTEQAEYGLMPANSETLVDGTRKTVRSVFSQHIIPETELNSGTITNVEPDTEADGDNVFLVTIQPDSHQYGSEPYTARIRQPEMVESLASVSPDIQKAEGDTVPLRYDPYFGWAAEVPHTPSLFGPQIWKFGRNLVKSGYKNSYGFGLVLFSILIGILFPQSMAGFATMLTVVLIGAAGIVLHGVYEGTFIERRGFFMKNQG